MLYKAHMKYKKNETRQENSEEKKSNEEKLSFIYIQTYTKNMIIKT